MDPTCDFVNSTRHAFFTCTINLTVNLTCAMVYKLKRLETLAHQ